MTRASVDASGTQVSQPSGTTKVHICDPYGYCWWVHFAGQPVLCANGRYLAFPTLATDITGLSTLPDQMQVVRKDLTTGAVQLVSISPTSQGGVGHSGVAWNDSFPWAYAREISISANGRFVAFTSFANNLLPGATNEYTDIYVRDMVAGVTQRIAPVGGTESSRDSYNPSISADGRFVAFLCWSDDMVPNDANGYLPDAFVWDRTTQQIEIASLSSSGQQVATTAIFHCTLSGDGRYVAFTSNSPDLVPGDTNARFDVFVRDRLLGTLVRYDSVSLGYSADYAVIGPDLSADGRFLAVGVAAFTLSPLPSPVAAVQWIDRSTGASMMVGASTSLSAVDYISAPSLSDDGRTVAYVDPDTHAFSPQVYAFDVAGGVAELVSSGGSGGAPNGPCYLPALDGTGRHVAFLSEADDLAPNDTNGVYDVFVRDRGFAGGSQNFCLAIPDSIGCSAALTSSGTPSASAGSGFTLTASALRNQKSAMFFYGTHGSTLLPFGSAYLCLQPPRFRTLSQSSGGSPGVDDCTGALALDFNAFLASAALPLSAGDEVWTQAWIRDPGSGSNTHVTEGLHFQLGP